MLNIIVMLITRITKVIIDIIVNMFIVYNTDYNDNNDTSDSDNKNHNFKKMGCVM